SKAVGHAVNNVTIRGHLMSQGKAYCAGNGMPFPSSTTQHWLISWPPFGPAHKPQLRRCTHLNWLASTAFVRLAAEACGAG
ncbi:MAG: hypothetical protein B6D71_13365, partial [gamma proteobacterium symbiont of Stewartia floridana]